MNTGKSQSPSDNTIETETTTAVGRDTDLSEDSQVLPDTVALGIDLLGADTLLKLVGVVDTLTTGKNLLSSDKHVESVCDADSISDCGAGIVELGVEGSGGLGELVDNVKVGVVLLADNLTQGLLLGSAHILVVADVGELGRAFLSEELLGFGKGQADLLAGLGEEEGLGAVNGSDGLNLDSASLCN
jgi:hypothetical protein